MAFSPAADELSALQAMRARLEVALQLDENWRALAHPGASRSQDEAVRRARDTRLEMALAENVTYRAWRHIGAAIEALREGEAMGPSPPGASDAGPAAGSEGLASADELPQEIRDRIRGRLTEQASAAAEPAREPEPPAARQSPLCAAPAGEPQSASQHPSPRSVAEIAHIAAPARRNWQEASVSFVEREPTPAWLPSAEQPADLGSERRSALFDRLRDIMGEREGKAQAFCAPKGPSEEAQVTILTDEAIQERKQAELRAMAINRFRKALLGD
jgi:hypothetical protein